MTSIHDHGLHQTNKQILGKKERIKEKMAQNIKKQYYLCRLILLEEKKNREADRAMRFTKENVYVCQPHCITEQNAVTCLLPFNTGEMSWSSIFDSRF